MITTRNIALAVVAALGMACGKVSIKPDAGDGAIDAAVDDPDAILGPPNLTVSPTSYEFGPVAVASDSQPTTFTFSNSGSEPATGCAAPTKSGTNPGDFTIVTDDCGTDDLAAQSSCTVVVSATPGQAGLRTMTLSRTCAAGGTGSTAVDGIAVNRPMYIFISSVSYNGKLGGLAGADALCNGLAAAGSLTASLGKTWKALLSKNTDGVVNAKDRIVWTGPLFDLRENTVTVDPSSWPWISPGNSDIGLNESGGPPDDAYVWTGTTISGVSKGAGSDCNSWSDETGAFNGWSGETASYPSNSWIDSFSNSCADQYFGLYCVSQ